MNLGGVSRSLFLCLLFGYPKNLLNSTLAASLTSSAIHTQSQGAGIVADSAKGTELHQTLIELDVKKKAETDHFFYTNIGGTGTYNAKDNFGFNKVKRGNELIWHTTDPTQYATKVVSDGLSWNSRIKNVNIYVPGKATIELTKAGGKWKPKSGAEPTTVNENSSKKLAGTTPGTKECNEDSGTKEDGTGPKNSKESTGSPSQIPNLGSQPGKNAEVDPTSPVSSGNLQPTNSASQRESTPSTNASGQQESGSNSQETTNGSGDGKSTYLRYTLEANAKCVGVKYEDKPVWMLDPNKSSPKSVVFVVKGNTAFVNMDSSFDVFRLEGAEWQPVFSGKGEGKPVNVQSKKEENDHKYAPNNKVHTYTPKDNVLFNKVISKAAANAAEEVVFETDDVIEMASKVVFNETNTSNPLVEVFHVNGLLRKFKKESGQWKEFEVKGSDNPLNEGKIKILTEGEPAKKVGGNEISPDCSDQDADGPDASASPLKSPQSGGSYTPPSVTYIDLDLTKTQSTDQYEYKKEDNVETYTAKPGFAIRKYNDDPDVSWKSDGTKYYKEVKRTKQADGTYKYQAAKYNPTGQSQPKAPAEQSQPKSSDLQANVTSVTLIDIDLTKTESTDQYEYRKLENVNVEFYTAKDGFAIKSYSEGTNVKWTSDGVKCVKEVKRTSQTDGGYKYGGFKYNPNDPSLGRVSLPPGTNASNPNVTPRHETSKQPQPIEVKDYPQEVKIVTEDEKDSTLLDVNDISKYKVFQRDKEFFYDFEGNPKCVMLIINGVIVWEYGTKKINEYPKKFRIDKLENVIVVFDKADSISRMKSCTSEEWFGWS